MNQASMLRQQPGIPIPQPLGQQPMFQNINTPHLISQHTQSQPGQQPQPQPNPMSMLPGHANPTPAMGLLSASAQPNGAPPNYGLQMQQANQVRRSHMVQQGMNPAALGVQPTMNGMVPNPMSFPGNMMRRGQSQPQGLNQVAHTAGMHGVSQVMGGIGGVPAMAGLGVNMNPAVRQRIQMPLQHGQQPHQQPQITGGQPSMQPDLSMLRQAHVPNAAGFGPHVARSASAQAHSMPNLQASASMPGSMQQSFQNPPMSQQHQHQHQHQQQQPQLATSPHPPHAPHAGQLPPNLAVQQGIQQSFNRARMTPEQNMFMSIQQSQQMTPNLAHAGSRIQPGGGGGFAFSNSTPPNQMGDVQQSLPNGMMGTPGTMNRLTTPAQALEQLQGNEGGFGMAPPQVPPQRPPSQQRMPNFAMQHVPQPPQPHQAPVAHASPRQLGQQIQAHRPQSQPQVPQGSPQQAGGMGHTPRMAQQQIAHNAGLQPPRMPMMPVQQQQQQPQPGPATVKPPTPSAPGHVPIAAARPPQATPQTPTAGPGAPPAIPNGPPPPPGPGPLPPQEPAPRAPGPMPHPEYNAAVAIQAKAEQHKGACPVGLGQCVNAVLRFSAALSVSSDEAFPQKLGKSYWDKIVSEFFTDEANMKITLWKDNKRDEAKLFEVGTPILPRFFLVTAQSGVKSIAINIDGARERPISMTHAAVECTQATWTFRYTNGYIVTLKGPFTAHTYAIRLGPPGSGQYMYKFDQLIFDANFHDKFLNVEAILGQRIPDSPGTPHFAPVPLTNGHIDSNDDRRYDEPRLIIEHATVPAEPVNAFGIPQATMRCLELAESVMQMGDLMQFARDNDLGPRDSLHKFAEKIREEKERNGGNVVNGRMALGPGQDVQGAPHVNGVTSGPSTIYAPQAPLGSQAQQQQNSLPQNVPPMGTPQQSKALPPGQAQPSGSTPGPVSASTPAAAPTPTAATTTPAMAHANLKRKATEPPPTTASNPPESSAKRPTRKRGRTTGGG